MPDDTSDATRHTVRVHDGTRWHALSVPHGAVLRDVLLRNGLSPYTAITRRANCGGRGICATCGVRVVEAVAPTHWHDRLAKRYGYPRLSCQIRVAHALTVRLVADKWVWGQRKPNDAPEAS